MKKCVILCASLLLLGIFSTNIAQDVNAARKISYQYLPIAVRGLEHPTKVSQVMNVLRESRNNLYQELVQNSTFSYYFAKKSESQQYFSKKYDKEVVSFLNELYLYTKPGVGGTTEANVDLIPIDNNDESETSYYAERNYNLFRQEVTDVSSWNAYMEALEKPAPFIMKDKNNESDFLYSCVMDCSSQKLGIFAAYLHHLAEQNPELKPEALFGNPAVQRNLDIFFGYVPWVESGSSQSAGMIFGNVLSNFGLGNAADEILRDLKNVKASKAALGVFYDSSDWATKTRYKIGRYGTVGLKIAGTYGLFKGGKFLFDQAINAIKGTSKLAQEQFLIERNKLLNDPIKLRVSIQKMMQEGIVGLRGTIDELTTIVTGDIAIRKSKDLFNKNYSRLLAFVGPPGSGKSLLAQKFALALTGKPIPSWGYITSASIKPGVSPVDQFFNADSELIKNLKRCGGNTVLFFDEVDKYDSNDLLEALRDAVDRGTIIAQRESSEQKTAGIGKLSTSTVINTETISVNGLIVIVGTNEKSECWGLEPDPDEPAYNVGRTIVERSGSIVQRFQRFKFHPYKVEEYKQMYDNGLSTISKDSIKMFGVQVVFDENLSKDLADESYSKMMGGRSVPIILSEMSGVITRFDGISSSQKSENKIISNIKKLAKVKKENDVQKVKVSFNKDTHKFIVELLK